MQTYNLPFSGAYTINSALNDLQNAVQSDRSQFSGTSEPTNTVAFQFWADSTLTSLKIRNAGNSNWISLFPDLTVAGGGLVQAASGAFTTNAPTSSVAASATNELARKGEVDARPLFQTAQMTMPLTTGNQVCCALRNSTQVATILDVTLVGTGTTSGSDGSNYHRFQVRRVNDGLTLLSTPKTTATQEMTGQAPYFLGVDQNTLLTGSTTLRLEYDKVGTPTNISSGQLFIVTSFTTPI